MKSGFFTPEVLASVLAIAVSSVARGDQGFGAGTPGGAGKPVVHVVNLADSGSGSLRAALSAGNRTIVFDVGGEIPLASNVYVSGAFVTIDGTTAPPPGITLRNRGLYIRGDRGAHDVIVRSIRVRDAAEDGIQVAAAAANVLIDHVSVQNSGDGNLDITQTGTRDVTVAWSILAQPAGEEKNMLLAFLQTRITLHHNIFIAAQQRSPQVTYDDSAARTQDADTTLDMRNNIVWDWRGGYGSRIRYGGNANVVANFYGANGGDSGDALIICKGLAADSDCYDDTTNIARAFVSANFDDDGVNLNTRGTEAFAFPAAPVDTQDACAAARDAFAGAGVRPLDAVDASYLETISLDACPPPGPTPSPTAAGTATQTPTRTQTSPPTQTASPTCTRTPTSTRTPTFTRTPTRTRTTTPTRTPTRTATETRTATQIRTSTPTRTPTPTPAPTPDLLVTALTAPANAAAEATITVGDTTKNQGTGQAEATTTQFYLSSNNTFSADDVLLGGRPVPQILPGASNSGSTPVTLPPEVAGFLFIVARADGDGALNESNESNNTRAVPITVGSDLIISAFTVPTSAAAGATIAVTETTRNQGPQAAGASTTGFYLSTDSVWDAGDVALGSRAIPALGSGVVNTGSTSVTVPVGTAPGSYRLIARADDDGAVPETRETNNTISRSLTVQ